MKKMFCFILLLQVCVACQAMEDTHDEVKIEEQEERQFVQEERHMENQTDDHEKSQPEEKKFGEGFNFETFGPPETIATGLKIPWSIQQSENILYISERGGTIVRIEDGQLTREEVHLTKRVAHVGEGGFLGFTLDPSFTENELAYAYHTYEENGRYYNRVVQLQYSEQGWQEVQALLEHIPGAKYHNGGRLQIGPDGMLYVTTGDALQPEWAQDLANLAGKILRMELDGAIPEDNPLSDSYIYSFGHRNPQGLAWNEDGSAMYSSEHGQTAHDEINVIIAGKNYGWPIIQGDETREGMETPIFHSAEETWAPSGIGYAGHNQLLVTGLRGNQLLLFHLEEKTVQTILEGEGRLRDVLLTDEAIYVITNNLDGRGNPSEQDDRLLQFKKRP